MKNDGWLRDLEERERLQKARDKEITDRQENLERGNLNQAYIREDMGGMYSYGVLKDYSTNSDKNKTRAYFRNLEDRLIEHIKECDVVLGCVAWLTNEQILKALARKKGVSLIIQKEDFLRPDITSSANWTSYLLRLYSNLPKTLDRRDFHETILGDMGGIKCTPLIDPVRCIGNYNKSKQSAFPRSHHKFVLFCKLIENCHCKRCQDYKALLFEDFYPDKKYKNHLRPYSVWTGSFNFTKTAVLSLENAVVLYDTKIVEAFFQEYSQIAALSESLDWAKPWIAPEWIIQTTT